MLNADKSEVMLVGTSAQLRKIDETQTVKVAGVVLPIVNKLKSLGVIVDCQLSFKLHVNAIAKACNYHIWALRHIRNPLSKDVAHTLARSIVMSKLDYCNAILHGSPKSSIAVLQRTQNSLARVVLQQPKYSSATPLLHSLHWLPIEQRIQFKLAVITYKVRSTKTPAYLHSVLSERVLSRTLRSSSKPLLDVVRTKTVYGERAFRSSAPTNWNSLPTDIQLACSLTVFKKRLKTFLFSAAFN
jgi:hypothetical protein